MSDETYPILQIQPKWVLEPEALGSKEKFWYRQNEGESEWLFKYPQAGTGQHWAEKISAEIASFLEIPHARVEYAEFEGLHGSTTESFVPSGCDLYHGNQILAGKVFGYDPAKEFRQSGHTLENIFLALDAEFAGPAASKDAKTQFATYLVLDAVIGNTDRHHENWGILRRQEKGRWKCTIAPTFDHASSLGRELLDSAKGRCREMLLHEMRIGAYAEKASGAVFWERTDKHGLSPLELVRRSSAIYPELFRPALTGLRSLDRRVVQGIINRTPNDWMTSLARRFALELVCYNLATLTGLKI